MCAVNCDLSCLPRDISFWNSCNLYSFRRIIFFLNWYIGGGVQLGPLGTTATNRPIMPAPGDYDNGVIYGMMFGRGNRSTRRKPAPVPLCPPQIPHVCPDANPGRRGGKIATNRLSLWWTKRHWGRFFPSTSVSPANHSTDFSIIIIITRGWYNRPLSGRSVVWTLIPPPTMQIKKN
jgi:hypothetical protein